MCFSITKLFRFPLSFCDQLGSFQSTGKTIQQNFKRFVLCGSECAFDAQNKRTDNCMNLYNVRPSASLLSGEVRRCFCHATQRQCKQRCTKEIAIPLLFCRAKRNKSSTKTANSCNVQKAKVQNRGASVFLKVSNAIGSSLRLFGEPHW